MTLEFPLPLKQTEALFVFLFLSLCIVCTKSNLQAHHVEGLTNYFNHSVVEAPLNSLIRLEGGNSYDSKGLSIVSC